MFFQLVKLKASAHMFDSESKIQFSALRDSIEAGQFETMDQFKVCLFLFLFISFVILLALFLFRRSDTLVQSFILSDNFIGCFPVNVHVYSKCNVALFDFTQASNGCFSQRPKSLLGCPE